MNEFNEVRLSDLWPIIKEQIDNGKSVKFRPGGTSMLPLIRPVDDIVIIKKAPKKLKKYDIILYRRENGRFVLHRVVGIKSGTYIMRGDNQNVLERGIKLEQILAIAEGIYKDSEYISFSGAKYWIYCRMRHYRQELSRLKRILKKIKKSIDKR